MRKEKEKRETMQDYKSDDFGILKGKVESFRCSNGQNLHFQRNIMNTRNRKILKKK